MQAIGIPGAIASTAKTTSRFRFKDVGNTIVAERQDKLGRWRGAKRAPSSRTPQQTAKKRNAGKQPAKSYKPYQNAANRTPNRRINAEHGQLLYKNATTNTLSVANSASTGRGAKS